MYEKEEVIALFDFFSRPKMLGKSRMVRVLKTIGVDVKGNLANLADFVTEDQNTAWDKVFSQQIYEAVFDKLIIDGYEQVHFTTIMPILFFFYLFKTFRSIQNRQRKFEALIGNEKKGLMKSFLNQGMGVD